MPRPFVPVLFAVIALALTAAPAHADRIDGSWCSPEGQSMTIDGRRITTPGGNKLIGEYTRHTFNYIVPEDETDAGGRVWAEQLNEQSIAVTVYRGEERETGPREIWTRCQVIS